MSKQAAIEKTDAFIDKYLVPGKVEKGFGFYRMVAESGGTDMKRIAKTIRRMSYEDYLHTRYWNLLAVQVKHDAKRKCRICGRGNNLVVHHPDYKWSGYDMYHANRFQCLCRICHERLHGLR